MMALIESMAAERSRELREEATAYRRARRRRGDSRRPEGASWSGHTSAVSRLRGSLARG